MHFQIQGKRISVTGKRITGGQVWRLDTGSSIARKMGRASVMGKGFYPDIQYNQAASNLGIDIDKVRYPRFMKGGSVSRNNIRLVL